MSVYFTICGSTVWILLEIKIDVNIIHAVEIPLIRRGSLFFLYKKYVRKDHFVILNYFHLDITFIDSGIKPEPGKYRLYKCWYLGYLLITFYRKCNIYKNISTTNFQLRKRSSLQKQ